MSDPELQSRLNDLGCTIPMIFVTGYPEVSTTVQAIKAGADDFLTKPIKSSDLLNAIDKALTF